MFEGWLGLILIIIMVGIAVYFVRAVIDLIPMEPGFKNLAKLGVILMGVIVVIQRAWPLLSALA